MPLRKKTPTIIKKPSNKSPLDTFNNNSHLQAKISQPLPIIIVTDEFGVQKFDSSKRSSEVTRNKASDKTKMDVPQAISPWLVLKTGLFITIWCLVFGVLCVKREPERKNYMQLVVPKNEATSFWIDSIPDMKRMSVEVSGPLLLYPEDSINSTKHSPKSLKIWVEIIQMSDNSSTHHLAKKYLKYHQRISDEWNLKLKDKFMDRAPEVKRAKLFTFDEVDDEMLSSSRMRLQLSTNIDKHLALRLAYDLSPIDPEYGVIYAVIILISLYVLIISEAVHHTYAAVIAAFTSVAVLAIFDQRPTSYELFKWMDLETILLLFSMTCLVEMFSETGIFDYLAVLAYKITRGRVWPLIDTLCIFTAIASFFLDNVTTALLITPVTIRLCEVMQLKPVPILTAMIMFSNIGGAMSPVGDPPNVIIATNIDIIDAGVSFSVFIFHMGVGVIVVMIFVRLQLRYMFRNTNDLKYINPNEMLFCTPTITRDSPEPMSIRHLNKLNGVRKVSICMEKDQSMDDIYTTNLRKLQEEYPIKDKVLLWKCVCTLTFVLMGFFLRPVLDLQISLGVLTLFGVFLLILLCYRNDLIPVFSRLDYSTLIFFTALFVLMEALSKLGLIYCIGRKTEELIHSVPQEQRLTVSIILVLWVSAFASSFLDNIPLTTMMVRIVTNLSKNTEFGLPLQPLVWSLALGACLGGNGTLFGASANMVCAGVAEQHGHHFSFFKFFKVGFPVMMLSVSVVMGYLLLAHVAFSWNS